MHHSFISGIFLSIASLKVVWFLIGAMDDSNGRVDDGGCDCMDLKVPLKRSVLYKEDADFENPS